MAAKLEPILTVADLDAMPEDGNRYELIEGELFVSCAPGLQHQEIVANLIFLFKRYLFTNRIGKVFPGPGVIFSNFSGVIPDVVFISNDRLRKIAKGARITGAPELVIEILSPGSDNERRDRHSKRQLYRRYGVKEYWIVNPELLAIEVYRTARFRLARTLGIDDELSSQLLPGFRCKIAEVFDSE
ncbi:MAG TPA: Uma2 family endonuclease [Blastocatellia bacterium]